MAAARDSSDSFSRLNLLILPQRIQKKRLEVIKTAARKREIKISETYCTEVSHVVTEFDLVSQALKVLKFDDIFDLGSAELVSLKWLTDSFKAGVPKEITEAYSLQEDPDEESSSDENSGTNAIPEWACQRETPLQHHNHKLTDAIEVLQLNAELNDGDQDYSRALAFRRASAVIKSLTFSVSDVRRLHGIKDIGKHVKRVVTEILEDGHSEEIGQIEAGSWFQKMKLFTKVFGVGPSTAKKWIARNISTIEEASQLDLSNDWRVRWGLAFHDELMWRVERREADNFAAIVRDEAQKLLPGTTVELCGGFRRGKPNGHDVDLLISHPREGAEVGLLARLLKSLEERGMILCGNHERNSFTQDVLTQDFKLSLRGQLDHFEKWLGICKFPKSFQTEDIPPEAEVISETQNVNNSTDNSLDDYVPKQKIRKVDYVRMDPKDIAKSDRDWIARRVDLIVTPQSQYYYALVGWTGSKHFNRDLRLYATRVLNMKLTSHGLYSMSKGTSLPAASEKEVFDLMKLPYRDPHLRNC